MVWIVVLIALTILVGLWLRPVFKSRESARVEAENWIKDAVRFHETANSFDRQEMQNAARIWLEQKVAELRVTAPTMISSETAEEVLRVYWATRTPVERADEAVALLKRAASYDGAATSHVLRVIAGYLRATGLEATAKYFDEKMEAMRVWASASQAVSRFANLP